MASSSIVHIQPHYDSISKSVNDNTSISSYNVGRSPEQDLSGQSQALSRKLCQVRLTIYCSSGALSVKNKNLVIYPNLAGSQGL